MGKLFWKYLFAFWLAVLAVELAIAATSQWLRRVESVPTLADETAQLRERVAKVSTLLAQGDTGGAGRLLRAWRVEQAGAELFVVDELGRELLGRPLAPEDLRFARAPDRQDAPFSQTVDGLRGQGYAVFIKEHVAGRIMYRTRIQLSWRHQFAAALLVGFCFSAIMAWYWAAPLRSLRWALHNVAQGRLNTRVAPQMGRRRDELSSLGAEFDRMAQRIELLVNAQRRLMHDVSHELRSPLARLEASIALALRRQGDTPAPEMERISREAQRLEALVGELLLLARLESGIDTPQRGRVDVMELVLAIADDAQFEARTMERDLSLVWEGTFVADVNAELLYRAFENVMRNAVKYTRAGSAVAVHAQAGEKAMVVTVADQGPGLPDEMLKAIFEPFRRFETDRDIGGFGLGLAIAQHAMQAHGGDVSVERNCAGGLTFTLCLPRHGLPGPA